MKLFLPLALAVLASGQTTVTSRAGFAIPSDDHPGSASIVANIVVTATGAAGSLTYAAEDHPDHHKTAAMLYPHVVVNLHRFQSAKVVDRTVEVEGYGRFHGDSIRVTAALVDNAGLGKPDHFEIVCRKDGHVVYERHGDIQTGDIAIRREP